MDEGLLEQKRGIFESFAETCLRPYISSIATKRKKYNYKIFNDPVWHSILLYAIEIIVLDSPLLQRLRRIRQLGVAHLVYPGAEHTRFQHSIGAAHQVAQLIASINASSTSSFVPPVECITRPQIKLLRMAALCHDIGQGVMSHVSENALESEYDVQSFKLAFTDKVGSGIEEPKLSEIAAYYLIGSPAFRELLKVARELSDDSEFPQDAANSMQNVVIGLSYWDDFPLLHEIITGPFDADKLDYMTRDAFMSGVPVVVDIPRLVQKVRAVRLLQNELPPTVKPKVKGGLPNYSFVGIDLSGGRTLDELMIGRSLLFDKIYRHQKVRAAEVMVQSLLSRLKKLSGKDPVLIAYWLTDEELMNINENAICSLVERELTAEDKVDVSIACDIAGRLRDRRLLVRCLAVASSMPYDAYAETEEHKTGLGKLLHEMRNPDSQAELRTSLAEETENILQRLGQAGLLSKIPGGRLEPYIWISPPKPPSEGSDVTRAYLIAGERKVLPFRDDAPETSRWADAYILTRDLGYIFAPDEFSKYVFLGAEKLLRTKYGIHIPSSMLAYSKQDFEGIDDIRRSLHSSGYYGECPRDIWPMPSRLLMADIDDRLEGIVKKLSGYQGYVSDLDSPDKGIIHPNRIKDWLRQFEQEDMVEAAVSLLEGVRLIGRSDIVRVLDSLLQQRAEFRGCFLCTLGLPKDSSAVVTYYGADMMGKYNIRPAKIEETNVSQEPIVFVDDFVGSGRQVVSILETWFECPKTVDLGEERGTPLPKPTQELLRKRKLAFVFSAGWSDGVEFLENKIKQLGLDALVRLGITEEKLPTAFNTGIFKSSDIKSHFLSLCTQIGMELMSSSGNDPNRACGRCLGYGNRANLVIFPYNTPTQTITCLWAEGQYGGVEWVPLFPRRKKR